MQINIVVMGPPTSGKTSVAQFLSGYLLGVPHTSTGDLLRESVKAGTSFGKHAKGFMLAGQLVPDYILREIMAGRLQMNDAANGMVLDGYPRTLNQASDLDQILEGRGTNLDLVINISLPSEVAVERMLTRQVCQGTIAHSYHHIVKPPRVEGICDVDETTLLTREDCKVEVAQTRLCHYEQHALPLRRHYREQNLLREIDGNRLMSLVIAEAVLTTQYDVIAQKV